MAVKIEVYKPIFIAYGKFPQDRLHGYILKEIELKSAQDFVGIRTNNGRAIVSNIESVYGEYLLDQNQFSPNRLLVEKVNEYSSYQAGYLQQPLLN